MSCRAFRFATRPSRVIAAAFTEHKRRASTFSSEIWTHTAEVAIQAMAAASAARRRMFMFAEVGNGTHTQVSPRTSHMSSSAIAKSEESIVKRFPVQVGASLKIDLSSMGAGVNVIAGENLEEVLLEPNWTKMGASDSGWEVFDVTSSDSTVLVEQRQGRSSGLELPTLQTMNAHMPARWCSLDVLTGLGSVYVQNVREGSLRVRTSGGHVTLGEIKGSEACINSGGGDVEAQVMQAKSSIETGGGKLSVRRIQGTRIAVDSGGGNVVLGSLYGDEVTVESKGGSVEAKEIQAQDRGFVSSNGGSVVIDGIDGKVDVISWGGNVDLQLNEHAQVVNIDAGKDGRVVLSLSAKLTAQLTYDGVEGVIQEGLILSPGDTFGVYVFNGRESAATREVTDSGWRGSENYLPDRVTPCKIHVSSAGAVYVKQRSWFDLVTSRIT